MGRRKKSWTKGEGKYYFTVKAGNQAITMFRSTKADATLAFNQYKSVGKSCEWLGLWNGDEFEEVTPPNSN